MAGEQNIGGIVGTIRLDGAGEFASQVQVCGAGLTVLESKLGASSKVVTQLDAGMAQVSRTSAESSRGVQSFARGMQEMSRGIEDFATGGALGLLNNIPQTFEHFARAAGIGGAGVAGLTAGVSLLATGIYVVYTHWDDLVDLFSEGHTATEAEAMEALAGKTKKTAEETRILNEHRREAKALEAMISGKSTGEKATEAAVQKAYDEGDAPAILAGLIASRKADNRPLQSDMHLPADIAANEERQAAARRVMAGGGTDDELVRYGAGGPGRELARLQARRKVLEEQREAARRNDALRIMERGKKDPTALLAEMRPHPELFRPGDIAGVEAALPGARAAREREDPGANDERRKRRVKRERATEDGDEDPDGKRRLQMVLPAGLLAAAGVGDRRSGEPQDVERRLGHLREEQARAVGRTLDDQQYEQSIKAVAPGGDAQLKKLDDLQGSFDRVAQELQKSPLLRVKRRR